MLVGAWLDMGLLVGVIFVMTAEPTSSDVTPMVVLAAIVLGLTALAYELVHTRPRVRCVGAAPAPPAGAR